jgi:RNase P subunit RPR2
MQHPDFIQRIPEITMRKARKLMKEEAVSRIILTGDVLRANVDDGSLYSPTVTFREGKVSSSTCTCNAEGSLCPHVVAAVLSTEEMRRIRREKAEKAPRVSATEDPDALRSLVESAGREELVDFILSLRSYYKDIPVLIRKTFVTAIEEDELRKERESLLESYEAYAKEKTEPLFMAYAERIRSLHELARRETQERNYVMAVLYYLMVYEVSMRESKGIDHLLLSEQYKKTCLTALLPLSEKRYTLPESGILFRYLHVICEENENPAELLSLLRLMKKYITSERDFDSFYKTLLTCSHKKDNNPSVNDGYIFLEYELLMMIGRVQEAEALKKEYPEVPDFRYMTVTGLVSRGKLMDALVLAEEGVEKAKYNWNELIRWLYLSSDVNKLLHREDRFVELSIRLVSLGEYAAYLKLKRSVSPSDWDRTYERLIENPEVRKNTKGVYKRILIEEKDLRRLVAFLFDYPELIPDYYDMLVADYPKESSDILSRHIIDQSKNITTRKSYEELLTLLERLYQSNQGKAAGLTLSKLFLLHADRKHFLSDLATVRDKYVINTKYKPE